MGSAMGAPESTEINRIDALLENMLNKTLSGAQLSEFNDDAEIGCADFYQGDWNSNTNEQKAGILRLCIRDIVRTHFRQKLEAAESNTLQSTLQSNVNSSEAPWD